MGDVADFERSDRPWTAQGPPRHQPDGPSMHDLVAADLAARKAFGLRKYGTPLQAHNGRDPLCDAYDECLDLAVYLRQAIAERNDAPAQLDAGITPAQ